MPQSRAVLAGHAAYPELCPDWIEQRIIHANVQLAVGPGHEKTSRTVALGRFGNIEIGPTVESGAEMSGNPPLWLEAHAQGSGRAIDCSHGMWGI